MRPCTHQPTLEMRKKMIQGNNRRRKESWKAGQGRKEGKKEGRKEAKQKHSHHFHARVRAFQFDQIAPLKLTGLTQKSPRSGLS